MKRPMLYWVSLFILGEVLSKSIPISLIGLGVAGVVVLLSRVPAADRYRDAIKENQGLLAMGVLFFVLGIICMCHVRNTIRNCEQIVGTEFAFEGTVTAVETSGAENVYIVSAKGMKIRITLAEQIALMPGYRIKGMGKVEPFSRATNPGGYDEQAYQYGKGIFLSLQKVEIERIRQALIPIRSGLYRLRSYLRSVYEAILDDEAGLAVAMVLGDKEDLETDIKQLYQRNGIAHLIAISGLHIAMIGGSLYHILRKLIGSYPVSAGAGVIFILLYGVLTGLSGATLRAVIMLIVSIGADVSGRRYDAVTSIAFALFLMLLNNPYQITQVGFLLSFGAIIGIAVINPIWKSFWPKLPRILDGLFVSVSVQIVLLPVMLYYFYEIPTYGVLLNVIVVPLMSVLLAVLIAGGILGSFLPSAAKIVVVPAKGIFWLYEWICNCSERLPFHTLCTGRPELWWIVAYYGAVVLFLIIAYGKMSCDYDKYLTEKERKRGKQKRVQDYRKWMLAGVSIFAGLLFTVFILPVSLMVCMFDVGQGDGIYIRTPRHHHILMDGGSSSRQKVGTYVLKNGIRYYGGNVLDYVFVSHSDSDHYSGITELLEDDTVVIRNFVLPDIANPDEAYSELEKRAMAKGCRIYYMKKGDVLRIDGVSFACINPEPAAYEDKNTGSLVLIISYRDFDMLLTGDMDDTVEKKILAEGLLEKNNHEELVQNTRDGAIEVLKVAHHGSATSSSEEFLQTLCPRTACISVGESNRYGHPAKEVMERLLQYTQNIYLTKDSGAITINTDGYQYQVETFLTP